MLTFRAALTSSTFLACTVAPAAAFAQTATAPVEATQTASDQDPEQSGEIVVTGSRINRPDLASSTPVTVVSGEQLRISGTTSVENYLREIPQAVAAIGSNTNNGNPGVATVSLRNLGETRTLVLVDGRRFVPFDSTGVVDLNMIPAAMTERVEVLTGGASTVYGSDAIAGVVNFILKRNFEGLEADGQVGITERGDGFEHAFSLTAGTNVADGRGNFAVNVGYVKSDAVDQGARDYSSNVLSASNLGAGGGSSTNAAGTLRGIPGPACASSGGVCVFDASGNLVPYVGARDGFNFNPYNLLQTPQEKWTATAVANYEISDDVEFFGRFSFANSRVSTIIAPSGTFNFGFDINYRTNPNLTAQARGVLANADADGDGIVNLAFGRRTVELGTRNSISENTAYQGVAGLRGDIAEGLKFEIFGQYGRTVRTQTFENDISFSRTQAGILDGSVNLFGAGKLTAAAGQAIRLDLQEHDNTAQTVAGGFLSYDLPFALGGSKNGGVVAGVEYRRDHAKANPDENLIQGNAPGFGSSTPIDAQLEIKEVYGEAKLPIFDVLSLEAGVRYADYKNRDNLLGAGNRFKTTSWKVGGEFQPIRDIRVRAMYQRAVRAPNLAEIGTPFTPGTGDVTTDPCSSDNLTPAQYAANGALAQLCRATGVSASAAANGIVGGPISGQVNNFSGGDINLTPERSTTLTAGVVVQPRFLSGFTATVDYFDIKVKNAIVAPPEQEIVNACYTAERDPNGFFCSKIRRNPNDGSLIGGNETGVDATFINTGLLRTEGIDFAAAYRFNVADDVRIALSVNATRVLKSFFQTSDITPTRECVGLVGKTCLRPQPKWQFIQSSTVSWGPASVQLRWRYIGKLKNDSLGLDDVPDLTVAVPVIGDRHYFDLTTLFEVSKAFDFRFGVNNLLDSLPPVVGNDYGGTAQTSGNTFPATYEPLGRSFFVGATVRF